MNPDPGTPVRSRSRAALGDPIVFALPALALAFFGGANAPWEAGAIVGAVLVSILLKARAPEWAREGWPVPAIGTAIGIALLAAPSVASEALSGAAGLAALYWIAAPRANSPAPFEIRTSGLLLPGVAVGLALAVTFVLPASRAFLGVASALLVGLLLVVALVLGWGLDAEPSTS